MAPGTGGGTRTAKGTGSDTACVALLSSVAVTVTVALPTATPASVSGLPVSDTVATASLEEVAETACVSPEPASATSTGTVCVRPMVTF